MQEVFKRSKPFLIGTFSERTGCHIETIRYYERIKLLPKPPRQSRGDQATQKKRSPCPWLLRKGNHDTDQCRYRHYCRLAQDLEKSLLPNISEKPQRGGLL